jgi:hypothetical protein
MRKINDNVVHLRHDASATSREAGEKALPKSGTTRSLIYEAVLTHKGLADFELEVLLNGKHQSISAGRRSLVIDGFLVDSGQTRTNESNNKCTVWVVAPKEWKLF